MILCGAQCEVRYAYQDENWVMRYAEIVVDGAKSVVRFGIRDEGLETGKTYQEV